MAFTLCNLGSGSAGNCTLVRCGRTVVLVDLGFSARETERRLASVGVTPGDLSGILLTHEHRDHVAGVPVAARRWRVPVICRPAVARAAGLDSQRGVALMDLPEAAFDLGDLRVLPVSVPHDAVETVGFRLEGEGIRAAYVTDLGETSPQLEAALEGCHVLALEANHDVEMTREGPYPWRLKERILGRRGHLSNEAAAALLARVVTGDTTQVLLAHLSAVNNAPHLALQAARAGLEAAGAAQVPLMATRQDQPGPVLTL